MINITMEFARQDDCLEKMVPSDLRLLVGERDRLLEQLATLSQKDAVAEVGPARTIHWLPPFERMSVGTKLYTAPPSTAQEDKLIGERDYWEEKATDLADAVGKHFGVDVGEHTSANCPIEEAHKILDGEYKTNEPAISKLLERVRDGIELVRVEMELYEAATDEDPPSFHLATIGLLRSCEAFLSQPTAQGVDYEMVRVLSMLRRIQRVTSG